MFYSCDIARLPILLKCGVKVSTFFKSSAMCVFKDVLFFSFKMLIKAFIITFGDWAVVYCFQLHNKNGRPYCLLINPWTYKIQLWSIFKLEVKKAWYLVTEVTLSILSDYMLWRARMSDEATDNVATLAVSAPPLVTLYSSLVVPWNR